MKDESTLRQMLTGLFTSQKLAVLGTYGDTQPYCTLMAFAATDDLRILLVSTRRQTRKYANLLDHDRVSLLVDNRKNLDEDFNQAMAVTSIGQAREVTADERDRLLPIYLYKHPYLRGFLAAPDCALIKITVDRYLIVSHFQRGILQEDYAPDFFELVMAP